MSDDKLQKSTSAIEVAGNIGEAITRAVSKDDKPATTSTRWPGQLDVCKCGHMYSQHNYSDSLGSKTDPLGFMYECRGEGFARTIPRAQAALCTCKQFEYSAENTPSPKMAPVEKKKSRPSVIGADADKIRWAQTRQDRCIDDPDQSAGMHACPGAITIAGEGTYYCKCACTNCLTAERIAANNESDKRGVTEIATMINGAVMTVTDDRTCIGVPRGVEHTGCPVVVTSDGGSPTICLCDCIDCKRLWFSDGRPIVRDGKIVRTTPETRRPGINAMFQSAVADADAAIMSRVLGENRPEDMLLPPEPRVDLLEVAKSLRKCTHPDHIDGKTCGDRAVSCSIDCLCCQAPVDTSAIDQLLDAEIFDAVEPGIPLTVEPLNPVLRAEGSREIAPLSEQERGRLFRTGVPAGEYKATVANAKIITDKNGRPQLAIEMKIEGSDEVVTMPVPSVDAEMVKEFVRVLGDDLDKPAVIGPLAAATSCEARGMDGVISVRCILPPGHKGTHIAEPLMPNRRRLEWSGE